MLSTSLQSSLAQCFFLNWHKCSNLVPQTRNSHSFKRNFQAPLARNFHSPFLLAKTLFFLTSNYAALNTPIVFLLVFYFFLFLNIYLCYQNWPALMTWHAYDLRQLLSRCLLLRVFSLRVPLGTSHVQLKPNNIPIKHAFLTDSPPTVLLIYNLSTRGHWRGQLRQFS